MCLLYSSVSLIGYPNKSLELSSSVLFIVKIFKTIISGLKMSYLAAFAGQQ